jgi:formylglycine-generating enzyme required for sulfatase activity
MRVTLSKGFWMAKTEVTQRQWKSVMGNNPSWRKGDDLPVDCVSWVDAWEFCRRAGMQLPTEAQWEYACRAGTTGARAGNLDSMAWYAGNSGGIPHPVGQKRPNAWGLHDMYGNVLEWCADWSECRMDTTPVTDPTGPASGTGRVLRGGSWICVAGHCRSAWRGGSNAPEYSVLGLGFRPVMDGP